MQDVEDAAKVLAEVMTDRGMTRLQVEVVTDGGETFVSVVAGWPARGRRHMTGSARLGAPIRLR